MLEGHDFLYLEIFGMMEFQKDQYIQAKNKKFQMNNQKILFLKYILQLNHPPQHHQLIRQLQE